MVLKIRRLATLAVLALTSACASAELDELKQTTATGDAFTRALTREYRQFATFEGEQMDDWLDAAHFAAKGLRTARGVTVAPEHPANWKIAPPKAAELAGQRRLLVSLLDSGARGALPRQAALAQARFDCWIEQQEEGFQPDDIKACRDGFLGALTRLTRLKAVEIRSVAANGTDGSPGWKPFRIYFGHDRADINTAGLAALGTLARALGADATISLLVTGHTDRSGPERYNGILSLRRADVVRAALIKAGIAPSRIQVAGSGESEPRIKTADHVREPRNRRSEISLR